jgi:hypothetical protein
MAIDSAARAAFLDERGLTGMLEGPSRGDDAVHWRVGEAEVEGREAARSGRRKRPLVGRVAAKPTMGWQMEEAPCS